MTSDYNDSGIFNTSQIQILTNWWVPYEFDKNNLGEMS